MATVKYRICDKCEEKIGDDGYIRTVHTEDKDYYSDFELWGSCFTALLAFLQNREIKT